MVNICINRETKRLNEDNTTYLLVADFDETSWQADVSAFCKCCNEYGLCAVQFYFRRSSNFCRTCIP
ncbi:TOTE conflict system archaeo-eukaryotic primase domain-containing protein [Agathobaculum butyriciproducens]|uniref:TOTE conflict system archaeo-eukaryotic primase domain-containing protein n=1 Tax=Agathobaculum butyriciproducens TaxID=1628085 RepID=UPI003F58A27C